MKTIDTIRRWVGRASGYSTLAEPTLSTQAPTPSTQIVGLVGTAALGGWLRDLGEYNSKLQPPAAFQIYEKMGRSDGDVAAVLDACMLPIRAAEYQILPGVYENDPGYATAKEIAEFVEDNLFGGLEMEVRTSATSPESRVPSPGSHKVSQSFESVVENALLMLPFGCAAHEPIYRVDSDAVRIAHFAPRLPSTFSRFYLGEDGETLAELEQAGYRGDKYERVRVPADRLDFFSFAREGANWWGRSLLRRAYKHWYAKEQLERIDAIACERNGMGVPVIIQADNAGKEDRTAAEAWVANLSTHERTGLVLPFGWTFKLQGVEGRPRDILPSMRYHSEMIVRSVLATFLAFGTTQTGARALGESATDFFKLALEGTAWLIAETMTTGSIRQLVDYNFTVPDATFYPRLSFANILATAPFELWKTVATMVQQGVFQADDDLEAAGREDLGLPVKAEPRVAPAAPAPGLGTQDSGLGRTSKDKGPTSAKDGQKQESGGKDGQKLFESRVAILESRASRRELKAWEAKVDYEALRRRQDATARKVARILRAAKPAAIAKAANLAAMNPTLGLQSLALPTDMNVVAQIQQAVTPAFEFGRTSVRRERFKATGRRGAATRDSGLATRQGEHPESRVASPESRILAADRLSRSKNAPRLVAEATWADFANWISPRAIAAAVDARKRGLEGADLEGAVGTALDEMADGGLDKIGMEAGRGALAGGRYATLADFDAEIAYYYRSEADDDRVCEVCKKADEDNTRWESLDEVDWQPGDDCEGGDLCRGQLVAVFADEGKVTSE